MKRILSIDGGGMRGIIPATILSRLESETGQPCAKLFDLMAGTSTGALVVCCLKKGMKASDIIEMYRSECKSIFQRSWKSVITSCFGLLGSKYAPEGIEGVLSKHLEDTVIGSDFPYLLIASLNFETGIPRFFKSVDDKDVLLAYAARASSAAPTYFPPKDGLVDGGIIANDPSMCALAEAYKLWDEEPVKMLSLGTGFSPVKATITHGGLLDWATSILDVFMNGEMGFAAYQTGYTLGQKNFMRVQSAIPTGVDAGLDNIDPTNIEKLIDFGHAVYDGCSIKAFL